MNYYVYVFNNKNTHHLIVDTELNNKYFSILVFPSSDPAIYTRYFMIGNCSTTSLSCLCAGNSLEDARARGCVAGARHHLLSHLPDLQLEADLGTRYQW